MPRVSLHWLEKIKDLPFLSIDEEYDDQDDDNYNYFEEENI